MPTCIIEALQITAVGFLALEGSLTVENINMGKWESPDLLNAIYEATNMSGKTSLIEELAKPTGCSRPPLTNWAVSNRSGFVSE